MPPTLLALIPLTSESRASIGASFDIIDAHDPASRDEAFAAHGERVRAVLTNGSTGISAADIERLPHLELIGALGAGYENIARDAAKARGIVVANGAGTNDDCVADHAFALLLATVRAIPALDQACRAGRWRDELPMQPNFSGKRLGVVGLGNIGRKVARRALGFDLEVGYHNRHAQPETPYAYFDALIALAGWADYLVVTTPGGAATRHLIDATCSLRSARAVIW